MNTPIPKVSNYMTAVPHSIGDEQTVARAAQMMQEHGIRHLPVLRGGKLLGIITDRDVRLIQSLEGSQSERLAVAEGMTEEPYTVSPEAPLDEVSSEMAEKKYGSAVVMQKNKVVGMFTTVDACRALADLLRKQQ